MREKIGDPYRTVGICGSFRKQMDAITEVHGQFIDGGFIVSVPSTISRIVNPGDEFVLFESDASDSPKWLEAQYQDGLLRSDVVYVCNPDGYIGGSVMMELGRLIGKAEVYFMNEPQEPVLREISEGSILSAGKLIECMQLHNEIFRWREWPDANNGSCSNFLLNG